MNNEKELGFTMLTIVDLLTTTENCVVVIPTLQ